MFNFEQIFRFIHDMREHFQCAAQILHTMKIKLNIEFICYVRGSWQSMKRQE